MSFGGCGQLFGLFRASVANPNLGVFFAGIGKFGGVCTVGCVTVTLVRQAKLGVSCRVKVPVGQGLANHPYRVLRVRRSVASGFDCCKGEQGRRSVHREPHRPQGIRISLKLGQHRYRINTVGNVVNVTESNTKKPPRQGFRGAFGVQGRGMCG